MNTELRDTRSYAASRKVAVRCLAARGGSPELGDENASPALAAPPNLAKGRESVLCLSNALSALLLRLGTDGRLKLGA